MNEELSEDEIKELLKVLSLTDTENNYSIKKHYVKMEKTNADIERFCSYCMAISLDMTKCDYCEFKFVCYTQ
jgi:hypothetical protein